MAQKEYNCNSNFSDLGNLDCLSKMGTPRRLILVPLTDADGDANEFATIAAVTKTAVQAKFDATDIRDRFFPTAELANVEQVREEVKVETDDYGIDFFIRHGVKSFNAKIWGAWYQMLERLSTYNFASNLGVFIIDNKGNFVYKTDASTKLKVQPIPIKSFYVSDEDAGAESVFKGMISYKYDLEAAENYLVRYIDVDDLDFDGLSTTDVYSLYDVTLAVTSPTTAGGTITAYIDGDSDQPVTGLLLADFTLVDDASGAETIDSVTDNEDGTYTATWTVTNDGYVLSASKAKYDFTSASFTVNS